MKKLLTGALTLLLFAGAAQAQTKDTARHHRGGHEMMAKQLNLTSDQQEKLKAIHQSQMQEMKALRDNKSLSADQQKAQRMELHKKYSAQSQAIYTPAQKEQLEKMRSEWKAKAKDGKKAGRGEARHKGQGFRKGGDFAGKLDLTEAQKGQMQKLRAESKSQFESVKNDKSLTDEQRKEKMKSLRQAQMEKMKSVLTKDQIEKLQSARKERTKK